MKNLLYNGMLIFLGIFILSGCETSYDYGPPGRDGRAYFGIDYDWHPPYSYWDNNPAVPSNPFIGEFYRTNPGTYKFEYFVNSHEYWYGTYQIWINRGEPGQPYGEPGRDGQDTHLLLICNHDGFYFDRWNECDCVDTYRSGDTIVVEGNDEDAKFRIEMTHTTIDKRSAQEPKYSKQK